MSTITEEQCREALKSVVDPELFVDIVNLGLVYEVAVSSREDGKDDIAMTMTLTSPACPSGPEMVAQSKQALAAIENAGDVEVKVVMSPPWTPERMTEDAKDQLGIYD